VSQKQEGSHSTLNARNLLEILFTSAFQLSSDGVPTTSSSCPDTLIFLVICRRSWRNHGIYNASLQILRILQKIITPSIYYASFLLSLLHIMGTARLGDILGNGKARTVITAVMK